MSNTFQPFNKRSRETLFKGSLGEAEHKNYSLEEKLSKLQINTKVHLSNLRRVDTIRK